MKKFEVIKITNYDPHHWACKSLKTGRWLGVYVEESEALLACRMFNAYKSPQACGQWQKERPAEEGWYFWKRSVSVKDTAKYSALFVQDERGSSYQAVEIVQGKGGVLEQRAVQWTCWEGAMDTCWPKGGWWQRIEMK